MGNGSRAGRFQLPASNCQPPSSILQHPTANTEQPSTINPQLPVNRKQALAQLRQSPGAMAQSVFHFLAQLREGLLIAFRKEKRVVAKAALPSRSESDPAVAHPLEQLGLQLEIIRIANRRRARMRPFASESTTRSTIPRSTRSFPTPAARPIVSRRWPRC